jgi:lambda family phage portal protein
MFNRLRDALAPSATDTPPAAVVDIATEYAPSLHERLHGTSALTQRPEQSANYHAGDNPHGHQGAASDLAGFHAVNQSADLDMVSAKETVEARIKSTINNNGYDRGAMLQHVAGIVGPQGLKLSSRPEWRAIPGGTEEWAREFSATVEARFRSYISSDRNSLDRRRLLNWPNITATQAQSMIIHGEIAAAFEPRRKPMQGEYQTAIQILDPQRISDPKDNAQALRERDIRGGIELDKDGVAVAAWISSRHKADLTSGVGAQRNKMTWTRHPFFGRHGRRRIFYAIDSERPEQTRGISPLAACLRANHMLNRLEDATLQAAVLQSVMAMVIKSGSSIKELIEAIGATDPQSKTSPMMAALQEFSAGRAAYYNQNKPKVASHNAKAIFLLPDEELEMQTANSGSVEVAEFLKQMRNSSAASHGLGAETYSADWSKTSFSSAKMSTGNTARIQAGRRERVIAPFCQFVFAHFVEEMLVREPGLLPHKADFYSNRDAILRSVWTGPPMLEPDPLKAAKAAKERMDTGSTTLEIEASAVGGDWEENMHQRARELRMKEELGLFELEAKDNASKTAQTSVEAGDMDLDDDDSNDSGDNDNDSSDSKTKGEE